MGLLRKLLWLIGFAALTLFFVVVFEHGCCEPAVLSDGFRQELEEIRSFLRSFRDGRN